MDDRLHLIQYLYDEADDDYVVRRLAEDEVLRREYERLRDAKAALDRLPSRSPDPEVVDRVVASAKEAARDAGRDRQSSTRAPAADRPARSPDADWTHRLQGVTAALAILLLVGIGWWALPGGTDAPSTMEGEVEASAEEARTGDDDAQAMPEWDNRDELVRIHRRLEQLQAQDQMGAWGERPQPIQSQSRP